MYFFKVVQNNNTFKISPLQKKIQIKHIYNIMHLNQVIRYFKAVIHR